MNTKSNVLIVSTSLNTQGGISSVVKEHINSQIILDYNLYHLATHINSNFFIKILYLISAYLKFPYIIIRNDISIIHIHGGMKSSFFRKSYFLVIGKFFRKKVILHMHSAKIDEFIGKSNYLKKVIITKLFNTYDVIIVISDYWKHVLEKYTNNKIVVIYNPIKPIRENIEFNKISDHYCILTMGELCERKGTDKVIKIASLIDKPHITFVICGNGNIDLYKRLAKEYNIQDKLIFKGWIQGEEKEEIIKGSSIYFLPSLHEGLPMSIIEAMAYGLPVISTNVGGIPEIVINGYNGFTHQPDDITGMRESILKLINDTNLLSKMGKNSLNVVQDKLSVNHIARQISNLYGELEN